MGTISAIAVTIMHTMCYVCHVWLISSVVSNELLIYSKLVLKMMALPSRIVAKLGIVTSCIGAALQVSAALPPQSGD